MIVYGDIVELEIEQIGAGVVLIRVNGEVAQWRTGETIVLQVIHNTQWQLTGREKE